MGPGSLFEQELQHEACTCLLHRCLHWPAQVPQQQDDLQWVLHTPGNERAPSERCQVLPVDVTCLHHGLTTCDHEDEV
jgi:hypothetical protein